MSCYLSAASTSSLAKSIDALLFEESDADNPTNDEVVTLIELNKQHTAKDVWHNLQGVRIAQPTTTGVYLRNGRKVIVK